MNYSIIAQVQEIAVRSGWFEYTWRMVEVGAGAFLGAYLAMKGKNLATSEDIVGLTKKVEKVKTDFSLTLESAAQENRKMLAQAAQSHDLRKVAAEKRLQAHQEAFCHWDALYRNRNDGERIGEKVAQADGWLTSNFLYLEEDVREKMRRAIAQAAWHHELLQSPGNTEAIKEGAAVILAPREAIVKAMKLEPLFAAIAFEE